MQALSVLTRRLGLCLIVVSLVVATDSVWAQCSCRTTRPFADCVTRLLGIDFATQEDSTYPDLFPGSGTIVTSETAKDRLYIADLFSGRAYVYEYDTQLIETVVLVDLVVPWSTSPARTVSSRRQSARSGRPRRAGSPRSAGRRSPRSNAARRSRRPR